MSLFKFNDDRVKKIMYIHFFCIFMLFLNYTKDIMRNSELSFIFLTYPFLSSYRFSNYKYSLKESKDVKFMKKLLNCAFTIIVIVFIIKGDLLNDPLEVFVKYIYILAKSNIFTTLFVFIGGLWLYFLMMSLCISALKNGYNDKKSSIKVASDNNIKGIKFIFNFIKFELVFTVLLIILDCNYEWLGLLLIFILGFLILPTLKDIKENIENESFKNKVKHIIESENKIKQ